ncbi:LacI family DNA-binding transcriptional regulator [Anaerococcus sp. Marseille-P9784]|uniref:LacI family DNA-binding transcriptional regulator n=1 Tax=Anaerococcus sp. Marseille-P9784 TaxID=2614127 RepID=UPI00124AC241|nr:LacI family DNA-binding transcriptional regulator [Anaerococcus sp. Marseille-P9784]
MSTIKDVAHLANVSITTVSMVLNNTEHKISSKTRTKVIEAAKELNYKPNNIARSLVSGKTNVIMLIIPDISNPFFGLLAKELSKYIRLKEYFLYIFNSNNEDLTEESFQNLIENNFVEATFVIDRRVKQFSKKILNNNKIVFLDEFDYDNKDTNIVTGDNKKGGYLAVEHLINRGLKKIGLALGPRDSAVSSRRLSGAIDCANDQGIHIKSENIFHANFTFEGGLKAGEYFLDKDVDAIFCFNDMSAYGLMEYLNQKKVKIPEDISIVGYDNLYTNNLLSTKLSSVDQNLGQLAKEAVNMIDKLIKNEPLASKNVFVDPKLVIRESTR